MKNKLPVNSYKKTRSYQRKEATLFYLYISPWLIGFICLTLGPMLFSLWLSISDASLGVTGNFIGFKNYADMFTNDKLFLTSLFNTFYYAFVSIPLGLILAFFLALLLNLKLKGIGIFRTIFYLPSVVAGVAVILLWGWMFNADYGLINYSLSRIGIAGPHWLSDPNWAMPAIIFMSLWNVGGSMLIFLAGLQGVPQELYESAEIDGANGWRRTLKITLPILSPVVFFNLIMGIIGGFQVFTQVYVLTNVPNSSVGGPLNSTYVYALHIFRNAFNYLRMGYGAALAWILFVIILGFSIVVIISRTRWVYTEEGGD